MFAGLALKFEKVPLAQRYQISLHFHLCYLLQQTTENGFHKSNKTGPLFWNSVDSKKSFSFLKVWQFIA